MSDEATHLAPVPQSTGVAMLPVGSSNRVVQAIRDYKELQAALDKHLENCVVRLDGKPFRKKNYWNAVATAFAINVEIVTEERIEIGDDWGYMFVCRAVAGNRFALGDGACTRSEKIVYQSVWNKAAKRKEYVLDEHGNLSIDVVKTAKQASVHNIRAHAHTRARGRAISNLVGFGEVTAEEVSTDENEFIPAEAHEQQQPPAPMSEKDAKRLVELEKMLEEVKTAITDCLTEWAERMFVKLPETSKRDHFTNKRTLLANNIMKIDFWPDRIKLEDAQAVLKKLREDLAILMRDVPPAQQQESKAEPAAQEPAAAEEKADQAAQGELPT